MRFSKPIVGEVITVQCYDNRETFTGTVTPSDTWVDNNHFSMTSELPEYKHFPIRVIHLDRVDTLECSIVCKYCTLKTGIGSGIRTGGSLAGENAGGKTTMIYVLVILSPMLGWHIAPIAGNPYDNLDSCIVVRDRLDKRKKRYLGREQKVRLFPGYYYSEIACVEKTTKKDMT